MANTQDLYNQLCGESAPYKPTQKVLNEYWGFTENQYTKQELFNVLAGNTATVQTVQEILTAENQSKLSLDTSKNHNEQEILQALVDGGFSMDNAFRYWGTCFDFDGSTGKITDSELDNTSSTESYTVSLWAKLEADPINSSDSQPLVVTKHFYCYVREHNESTDRAIIRYDDVSARQAQVDIPNYSAWNHYAFVYDYNSVTPDLTIKVYLNGVLGDSGTRTTFPTATKVGCIGNLGSGFFEGKMDNIKVWNEVLTDQQIADEYAGKLNYTNNMLLYYKGNEGSGTTATDSSPNNNSGTLSAGVTYVTDPVL